MGRTLSKAAWALGCRAKVVPAPLAKSKSASIERLRLAKNCNVEVAKFSETLNCGIRRQRSRDWPWNSLV